ncbi:MAG: MerR family transcriptional regulator [Sporichthyaceae bacterium]
MASTRERSPQPVGRWTAGAVAQRLGVSPSTLRTWNHRYGVGPVQDPGTHRLYSDADVAELQTILRLVEAGTPVRAAVQLARTAAPPPAAEPVARTPAALAGAAWELNSDALTAAFVEALGDLGVLHTWQRLCRPAMARLAARASESNAAACIGAEMVLTNALTTALHHALSTAPPPAAGARGVLLACTSGELHGLSLLVLQVTLAEAAVPSVMLGTGVADDVLVEAAVRSHCDRVVVYAHRREATRIGVLRQLAEERLLVLAAGPGWSGRRLPAGVVAADDLPTALRLLGDSVGQ